MEHQGTYQARPRRGKDPICMHFGGVHDELPATCCANAARTTTMPCSLAPQSPPPPSPSLALSRSVIRFGPRIPRAAATTCISRTHLIRARCTQLDGTSSISLRPLGVPEPETETDLTSITSRYLDAAHTAQQPSSPSTACLLASVHATPRHAANLTPNCSPTASCSAPCPPEPSATAPLKGWRYGQDWR